VTASRLRASKQQPMQAQLCFRLKVKCQNHHLPLNHCVFAAMRQRKKYLDEVMYGSERCEKVAPACGVGSCCFRITLFRKPSTARSLSSSLSCVEKRSMPLVVAFQNAQKVSGNFDKKQRLSSPEPVPKEQSSRKTRRKDAKKRTLGWNFFWRWRWGHHSQCGRQRRG